MRSLPGNRTRGHQPCFSGRDTAAEVLPLNFSPAYVPRKRGVLRRDVRVLVRVGTRRARQRVRRRGRASRDDAREPPPDRAARDALAARPRRLRAEAQRGRWRQALSALVPARLRPAGAGGPTIGHSPTRMVKTVHGRRSPPPSLPPGSGPASRCITFCAPDGGRPVTIHGNSRGFWVPRDGIEPPTRGFSIPCSTN
jgi:hypothetical protein